VNCSGSPDCVTLNRKSCVSTAGTCGECLSGYLGESGDANSKCVSLSNIHARSLRRRSPSSGRDSASQITNTMTTAIRCITDSDCNEDEWEVCSLESGECVMKSKSCPSNCSNAGECIFVSRHDWRVRLSECGVLDVDCESRCECWSGFQGVSCNYNEDEFASMVESRDMLVESLSRLSSLQDASVSSVLSWLAGLSSMSSDSRLLGVGTKLKIAEMSLRYLESCRELGLPMEDIVGAVGSILDLILDVGLYLDSGTRNSSSSLSSELVLSLLDAYNNFIQSDLVVGQQPVNVLNRLFRSSHYCVDQGVTPGGLNLTISPPRSDLEMYLNHPYQEAILPQSALLGANKVSIVESQFTNDRSVRMRSNGTNGSWDLLSAPLQLLFDAPPCNLLTGQLLLMNPSSCVTQITLQKFSTTNTADHLTEDDFEFVELRCEEGETTSHNLRCKDGHVLELSCNRSSAGVLRQRCPIQNLSTVCLSLLDNQECKMISNENERGVVCECSLLIPGVGDDSSSPRINFGVVGRSLVHEFVSTWLSADDLTVRQIRQKLVVLFTIGSVGLIGLFFILTTIMLDSRDRAVVIVEKAVDVGQIPTTKSFLSRSLSSSAIVPKKPFKKIGRMNPVSSEERRLEESLPLVMRPVPLFDKCKNELRMYHRWLGIIFHFSESYPRYLRALSLVIGILTMLFVQSVTYDLADPDDGSCEQQSTLEDCLREQSMLANEHKCLWDSEFELCSFRPIQNDFERVLVVALISGILSAPFSILFQSLILFVLAAKTRSVVDSSQRERQRSARVSNLESRHPHRSSAGLIVGTKSRTRDNRGGSNPQGGGMSGDAILGTSLHEDLNHLLSQLRLYRQHLPDEKLLEFDRKPSLSFLSVFTSPLPPHPLPSSLLLQSCGELFLLLRQAMPILNPLPRIIITSSSRL
jgi:hypothetical protein